MMKFYFFQLIAVIVLGSSLACSSVKSTALSVPAESAPPAADVKAAPASGQMEVAVLAGGCFWGVEAVFESIKGVSDVRSGYAGGSAETANYDDVSDGNSKHAEVVEVTFDPSVVSYKQLLEVFFTVAHNPTELNRQGPDTGTQYRSEILFNSDSQKKEAEEYIAKLTASKTFSQPIVTAVVPMGKFYVAEEYHQDYLRHNPDERYIVVHDKPKVENLAKLYPALYVQK